MGYTYVGFPSDALDSQLQGVKSLDIRNNATTKGKLFRHFETIPIPAGQTYDIQFTTPAEPMRVYSTNITTSADKLTYEYREDAVTTGGSPLTPRAHSRTFGDISNTLVLTGVTTSDPGQIISGSYLPGSAGVGQIRSGVASGGGLVHWDLKPNSNYLIRLINDSTETNIVQYTETWIEGDL